MCVWTPHLQCGQHNLLHRGEVRLPEELGLLSEGQDLILVDGANRGRDLERRVGARLEPEPTRDAENTNRKFSRLNSGVERDRCCPSIQYVFSSFAFYAKCFDKKINK